MKFLLGSEAQGLVAAIEKPLKGVPHLPKGLTDFLVTIAPWLAGLGGVASLYSGAMSLFFSGRQNAMFGDLYRMAGLSSSYIMVAGVFALVSGALLLMAFNPLKARRMDGWMYLFWANMLGIVQSIVGLVMGYGSLVGSIVGVLIGLYILFEVKPAYK